VAGLGSFTYDANDSHPVLVALTASGARAIQVNFEYVGGAYRLIGSAGQDGGGSTLSSAVALSDASHYVELDWQAASGAGANDGSLTLWLDGSQQASATGVDNDTLRGDRVRLGAVRGVDSGTRGTYELDGFVSRRTNYIGGWQRIHIRARLIEPGAGALPPQVVVTPPAGQTWKLYYYAGSQRIAERVLTSGGTNTLYYLHGDHLGSMSVMTCGSGCPGGVISGTVMARQSYYAYGATRLDGNLPTDFSFTGQRAHELTGLIYFNARWYDPYLNRWTQPDSIVPNLANAQSLNRYTFVRNNPVRYTDPTGHRECDDRDSCGAVRYRRTAPNWAQVAALFSVKFTGKWSNADMRNALVGVIAVGARMAATTQQADTASQAFKASYGISPSSPMVFDMYEWSVCEQGCWGRTYGHNSIRIYRYFNEIDDAGNVIIGADGQPIRGTTTMSPRLTAHELGHAFNASASNVAGVANTPYESLLGTWNTDPTFPHRADGGFAGAFPGWQQSLDETEGEEFADMFIGWTFNAWASGDAGSRRSAWMRRMSDWLTVMIP
jgi:RHS repeat-associated protein